MDQKINESHGGKSLFNVVPIGDNVKLLEEHHKDLIEYWISINGYKLMIPIWFYNSIFNLYEADAFLCTKYFYLDDNGKITYCAR